MLTKLSELIFGKISNLMPTLRNSIEIEVTGAVVLAVNVTRPLDLCQMLNL